MKAQIQQIIADKFNDLVDIRKHIHAHPELSFKEEKTSAFVKKHLDEWGISYTDGWAGYGIVATIEGELGAGKTVAVRGDMDALPIQEENEVTYKSTNDGIMHACGHDVHTTCLLGVAYTLNSLKSKFGGKVVCVFQPGEEQLPGGASMMIKEGVFKNGKPDAMLALHVHPPLEVGKIGLREGIYMASTDEIHLTVKGKGGHGAMPHTTIDPVLMSARILNALQEVVGRNCNPVTPSVLSFGKIESKGGATNVIPEEVYIGGTFRTFDEEWRKIARQKIKTIAEKTAEAFGGSCEVNIIHGYPYLHNDEELTARVTDNLQEYLGEDNVIRLPQRMTAEDFSFFSQETKTCFFRVGIRNEAKGITSSVHTPTFDIDEKAIKIGAGAMAYNVWELLQG